MRPTIKPSFRSLFSAVLKYHEAGESGPDHDKVFLSEVSLDGEIIGCGSGRTKKEAEQAAACKALERLNK